jgi:hypothetical protein
MSQDSMPELIDDSVSMPASMSASTSESESESMPELVDDLPPPMTLPLSRSFSNYNDPDTKAVENWFYQGGVQPTDQAIQGGFPILYNQVYSEDIRGKPQWTDTFHFTEEQQARWEVMETIAGMKPIMKSYQQVHYEYRGRMAAYKEKFNK